MKVRIPNKSILLLYVSGIFVPLIRLFFLYNRNASYVPYMGVLVVMGLIIVMFSALFWLVMLIFKSPLSAFLSCLIGWITIESVRPLGQWLGSQLGLQHNRMLLICLLAVILIVAVCFLTKRIQKPIESISRISILFFGILFFLNAGRFFCEALTAHRAQSQSAIYKTSFIITQPKDEYSHADVYWLHLDGMMAPEAFEKYFNVKQNALINGLNARGFERNRTSSKSPFRSTDVALPALVSPYFYDHFLDDERSSLDAARETSARFSVYRDVIAKARLQKEMLGAFAQAGYNTVSVSPAAYESHYMTISDKSYSVSKNASGKAFVSLSLLHDDYEQVCVKGDSFSAYFDNLLLDSFLDEYMTPFSTAIQFLYSDKDNIYGETEDITQSVLETESGILSPAFDRDYWAARNATIAYAVNEAAMNEQPDMIMLYLTDTHPPCIYDNNGQAIPLKEQRMLSAYKGSYAYFSEILLTIVDHILLQDPDAVIVLQADHGFRIQDKDHEARETFGDDASINELALSALSAIRVPEPCKDGTESFAVLSPLNMSRYLVNRFVGEGNYDYIDSAGD